MLNLIRPALAMLLGMTLLTGLAYPLAMTGVARVIAPEAAQGSLIRQGGAVVGSALIAQGFTGAGYLHPRPSAAGYNAMASGASNLGPTSAELAGQIAARRADWQAGAQGPAPVDALTASGSGLDPDISPENALGQARRIAAARGLPEERVRAIIGQHVARPWLRLYGAPRVNVLLTNLALDAAAPAAPAAAN